MYSIAFNEQFAERYDFIDFVAATGLKAPHIGPAFKAFKKFAWNYILDAKLGALSECFEAWTRNQTEYHIN